MWPWGYISDEIDVSTPGISGWISSTTYNGTRLLVQGHLKETPVVETTRLELASVVLGTCEWLLAFKSSGKIEGSETICLLGGTFCHLLAESQNIIIIYVNLIWSFLFQKRLDSILGDLAASSGFSTSRAMLRLPCDGRSSAWLRPWQQQIRRPRPWSSSAWRWGTLTEPRRSGWSKCEKGT